ncbi:Hormone receptor-like protein [Sarcoptes scabiei]|uniref:Hormone receptor-like protein n=1 Tax=Sarcoptes scabiei TaxID=52283 RepID=A0A132A557_SARSC|nr:Hormone receptor-like protein [Sarcoptes scabiei]
MSVHHHRQRRRRRRRWRQHKQQRKRKQQCPPTWDGWLCWDEYAEPNQLMERPCPKHIYWHQRVPPCRGYVTKFCNQSGQWFINQDNREWSNYTLCARDDIYARRIRYSLI